ncbi:hypothetical protein SAY86_018014 [Trapa natans]|uniref:Uncharacterized protein n=1 Tax=Trapa natans TaxID=22666 RepID=A0AAN7LRA3_TRANT|nr:hypothetical protein SAY86_018014 [Trapa natans]
MLTSARARCGPSLAQVQALPRNYRSSSSKSSVLYMDEDLRELVRAASASTKNLRDSHKIQIEIPAAHHHSGYHGRISSKIARSFTSEIGRIDGDRPREFGEEHARVDGTEAIYPPPSVLGLWLNHKVRDCDGCGKVTK